jgi:hypothetical protein
MVMNSRPGGRFDQLLDLPDFLNLGLDVVKNKALTLTILSYLPCVLSLM